MTEQHWIDRLPVGSILVIGHPANGVTARREENRWAYTHNTATVQLDDLYHGAVLTVFNPKDYAR